MKRIEKCEFHKDVDEASLAKHGNGQNVPSHLRGKAKMPHPCGDTPTHACENCGVLLCYSHAAGHRCRKVVEAPPDVAPAETIEEAPEKQQRARRAAAIPSNKVQ